jgi:hypothetical protein
VEKPVLRNNAQTPSLMAGKKNIGDIYAAGMLPAARYYPVEIPTNTTAQTFTFPQNLDYLERGIIYGMIAYNLADKALLPSGVANVNNTVFDKAYLQLYKDSDFPFLNIPLSDLRRANNNGQVFLIEPRKIDFSMSKILLPNTASVVTTESFFMGFIYKLETDC